MKLKDGFKGEQSLVLPKALIDCIESDPLASSIYITDIGYYPHAKHHYRRRVTPISQYVFIYCVNGKGWYRVNETKYSVVTNQYFILPASTVHEYAADEVDPWTIYWIHFSGTLAPYYAADCIVPHDVTPSIASRINVRNNLFEEIFRTLNSSFAIESIRYAMASFHHYLASLRYIEQFRNAAVSSGTLYSSNNIERPVVHYFSENIGRTISLAEVADYVGLSASHFSTLFKKATGRSPLHYFNLMKIRRACELLDTTDMTIAQISMKLGLEDPYYFSRLFSKTMGLSPRAYRTRMRP
ncbi:MAG: AraC family transcriptional regulator [Bacteroidales bacterium]|nr:AraC family transcriptional regulator [Bacteroidales bacterium]